jgi:hypothetical protein
MIIRLLLHFRTSIISKDSVVPSIKATLSHWPCTYACHIIGFMRDVPVLQGEYSNWKDSGCELHSLCLECPFPRCLEEKARGKQRMRLKLRASAMRKMRRRGNSVRIVALFFGMSVRTIQREMKRMKGLVGIVSALRSAQ